MRFDLLARASAIAEWEMGFYRCSLIFLNRDDYFSVSQYHGYFISLDGYFCAGYKWDQNFAIHISQNVSSIIPLLKHLTTHSTQGWSIHFVCRGNL